MSAAGPNHPSLDEVKMYRLQVFHSGSRKPVHMRPVSTAKEVLPLVRDMLKEHGACERIDVGLEDVLLFSVDRKGNRIERRVANPGSISRRTPKACT